MIYIDQWQCLLSVPFESIFMVVLNVVCQLLNKLYPGIQPRLKIGTLIEHDIVKQ